MTVEEYDARKRKQIEQQEALNARLLAGQMASRGVGDTITKITHRTGIAQIARMVGCGGCHGDDGRQGKLNRMFPYKKT